MGIPAYFAHLIKNYNVIQSFVNNQNVEYLFLDSNSIIYDMYYSIVNSEDFSSKFNNLDTSIDIMSFESHLINTIINYIDFLVQQISPSKLTYISLDGVAPEAKMLHQRNRRYFSSASNNIKKHYGKNIIKQHLINNPPSTNEPINLDNYIESLFEKSESLSKKWSTVLITPATDFMNKLNKRLYNYYGKNNKYLVSGSDIVGEGEYKIFKFLRNLPKEYTLSKDKYIYVYGLDADLIMLCLCHLNISNNIMLIREDRNTTSNTTSNFQIVDINLLAQNIPTNHIYDYIILCFFLGNDFLPKFPSLNLRNNSIDYLLDIYNKLIFSNNLSLTIFSNGKFHINWNILKILLIELAKNEHQLLKEQHNNLYKYKHIYEKKIYPVKRNIDSQQPTEDLQFLLELIPSLHTNTIDYINIDKPFWQFRYYNSLLHKNNYTDHSSVQNICIDYFKTFEWTFKYYTDDCYDWQWSYQYHYPPLLNDLVHFVPFNTLYTFQFFKQIEYNPYHHFTQLLFVLPTDYLHKYLPKHLLSSFLSTFKQHLTSSHLSSQIEWTYCKYLWESHMLFDHNSNNFLKSIESFVCNFNSIEYNSNKTNKSNKSIKV